MAITLSSPKRFSTSTSKNAVMAAPPISERNGNRDLIQAGDPARVLPASPAYFSAHPQFVDNVLELENIKRKYELLPTLPASQTPRVSWLKLAQYRGRVGEPVPASKFQKVIRILQRLNQIDPSLMPDEVREAMRAFVRPGSELRNKVELKKPDETGRAKAIGRRKNASARVYLVEGDGQVLVNNKNLVDVFPRLHDRESVLWPLRVTQRADKYNVWALAQGGGVTGQAESITLALARALIIHEPALKPVLRRAGVVSSDPRQVERKKPGHVKARKMPTWVKR